MDNNMDNKIYRVYCSGVFDLFHLGHMLLFEKIHTILSKSNCNFELIVGIHNDNDCQSYKRKPIIEENIRYDTVKHAKYVDSIIMNAPLQITKEFLEEHYIDFVIIGKEYESNHEKNVFFHKGALEMNNYLYVERADIISTSDIIRLVKEAE